MYGHGCGGISAARIQIYHCSYSDITSYICFQAVYERKENKAGKGKEEANLELEPFLYSRQV
jgi:hypothetical protein